jgi:hypothetical protein
MITAGTEGSSATFTLGQAQKPIYLKVYLVNNKDEQKSIPLDLEDPDRFYVAWITTPSVILNNLATATDIGNSVKVAVKTPVLKNGQNVEHSLQVWLNFESESDQIGAESSTTDQYASGNTDYGMPDVPAGFGIDVDTMMGAPGTAAGFPSTPEELEGFSESRAMSFEDFTRKKR